jgi:hypothetical protein
LNIRNVIVEDLVRDPDTGEYQLIVYTNFRAAELPGTISTTVTVIWDEMILDKLGQTIVGNARRWVDCGD